MHIQIITFSLKGISEEDYQNLTEDIAPAFNDLPGLVSKSWLANSETNTFGGVYVWRDREAMEGYKETDIYKGIITNPHFDGVSVKDFAVIEGPSQITHGLVKVAV